MLWSSACWFENCLVCFFCHLQFGNNVFETAERLSTACSNGEERNEQQNASVDFAGNVYSQGRCAAV